MFNKRHLARLLLERGANPDLSPQGALSAREYLANADEPMRALFAQFPPRDDDLE